MQRDDNLPIDEDGCDDDHLLDESDDVLDDLTDEDFAVADQPDDLDAVALPVEEPTPSPVPETTSPVAAAPPPAQPSTQPPVPAQPPASPQTPVGSPATSESAVQQTASKPASASDGPVTAKPKPAPAKHAPPKIPKLPMIELSIPNGSEGKPYDQVIQPVFPSSWPDAITLPSLNFQLAGLNECGVEVQMSDRELHLSGTPNKNGDVDVSFSYTIPRELLAGRPSLDQSGKANWYINPDPRSLWKNVEPDPSLPYHKEHAVASVVNGDSMLIGASVRGRSHAHEGTFRDDEYGLEFDAASGWYLMTVCDGAGSAKFSRRGSQIACESFRDGIIPHFSGGLSSSEFEDAIRKYVDSPDAHSQQAVRLKLYEAMGGSAIGAFKAIKAEADPIENCEINQFATTVIYTIAKKFDFGWFAGAFCVGDGGVSIYSANNDIRVLNKPDGGEFAGQTRFITMSDIWASGQTVMDRIHFDVADDVTAIIAMTDGVSDAKFGTDNNFFDTNCWHELWADITNEVELNKGNLSVDKELLAWLNFWSPGNHDDRTIALLLP